MRTAGLMPPSTATCPTPGHGAQALRHQRVGEVGERAQRDGVGRERQRDDRRIGRVHLGVGRRIGQVARQGGAGGVDGGLHVLRGGIDVAIESELQRDLADAEGRGRRHGGERRDLPELALQRRGHQVGHGLGVGARQLRRDLDGREVDLRQRGDRQPPIAEPAAEHHGERQQRGGDGPLDEGGGDAHSVELPSALRASPLRDLPPRGCGRLAVVGELCCVGLQAGAHAFAALHVGAELLDVRGAGRAEARTRFLLPCRRLRLLWSPQRSPARRALRRSRWRRPSGGRSRW